MRAKHKRDANEAGIVKALRGLGALVLRLDEFDLIVQYRGRLFMVEVKMPKGRMKPSQEKLLADGWDLRVIRSEDEAIEMLGVRLG